MSELFLNGMDVSFLDEIEQTGGTYSADGHTGDALDILKRAGANSIRLRVWNDPAGGFCNLERTVVMAQKIKSRGLHFLLDFHYSDKWADPMNQWKPEAWEALSFEQLTEAVGDYTEEVLRALQAAGALPDMVQIGNEITPGMLWDEGRVGGEEYDTDEQWRRLAQLVKSGVDAAKRVDEGIRIMIHIDRGGDNPASRKFYDRFAELGVPFDTIGLSFYPWWHGTLEDLRQNLHDLADRYGKEIVVVETAYPWTLTPPASGEELIVKDETQLLPEYPATVEGQARYLQDFIEVIRSTPGGKGIGFHYWEPAWIPSKREWSVGHANNWSNLTLFDYEGKALDSLSVIKRG